MTLHADQASIFGVDARYPDGFSQSHHEQTVSMQNTHANLRTRKWLHQIPKAKEPRPASLTTARLQHHSRAKP
jgi:hypothetical protein